MDGGSLSSQVSFISIRCASPWRRLRIVNAPEVFCKYSGYDNALCQG